MVVHVAGRYEEPVKEETFPLSLDKLVLKFDQDVELKLELAEYKSKDDSHQDGWYVVVFVEDDSDSYHYRLYGHANQTPFKDRKEAEKEYQRICTEVRQGNYTLEYDTRYLKLKLTKP